MYQYSTRHRENLGNGLVSRSVELRLEHVMAAVRGGDYAGNKEAEAMSMLCEVKSYSYTHTQSPAHSNMSE